MNLTDEELEVLQRTLSSGNLWRISPQMTAIQFSKSEGITFTRERHQQLISDAIVEADLGTGPRFLAVSMPPQHGKSELISRRTPEWYLGRYPHRKIGIVGYGANFAQDWGRKVRDDMITHEATLGFKLKDDSQSKSLWHTDQGGELWTAGIKSGATGRGADLLIMDDPIKNFAEAKSPEYRQAIWDELIRVFFARLSKRGIVIVVMTRWDPDDPIGRVLGESVDENGDLYDNPKVWREIRLPAIWDDEKPITYTFGDGDWTRNKGDVLCSSRFDAEAFEIIKGRNNEDSWAALYQQDPNKISKRASVYYPYDKNIHEEEVARDHHKSFFLACDFNRTPMSWCYGQFSETFGPRAYLTNEIIVEVDVLDEISISESNVPEACEAFLSRPGGFYELHQRVQLPVIHLYGDAAGKAESHAGPDLSSWAIIRKFFRDRQIKIIDHVPSKDPLIQDRVNAMNNALKDANGRSHLHVDPKCKRLRQDLEKVTWKRDSAGMSTGKLDPGPHGMLTHMSDSLGYMIHTKFAIRPSFGPQAGSPR